MKIISSGNVEYLCDEETKKNKEKLEVFVNKYITQDDIQKVFQTYANSINKSDFDLELIDLDNKEYENFEDFYCGEVDEIFFSGPDKEDEEIEVIISFNFYLTKRHYKKYDDYEFEEYPERWNNLKTIKPNKKDLKMLKSILSPNGFVYLHQDRPLFFE